MYYVASTQSTPNIIGNASEIHEEQDQQEESVGQTTIVSTRRQKREKARAAKIAEEQQNFSWVTRVNLVLPNFAFY